MCLLQLSCLPQWTLILPISSSSQHVSSERPVNTSPNWHPCCRQWAWKQAFARTWPLESTWFEAQMRRKHHFHSEASWSLPGEWFPNLKFQKRFVKEQTSLCKSKILEACLRSNCSGTKREMLQSVHLGGCNRSEPEMRCVWLAVCLWLWGLSFLHYQNDRASSASTFQSNVFFFVTMSYRIINYMLYSCSYTSTQKYKASADSSSTDLRINRHPQFMLPLHATAKGKNGLVAVLDGTAICESGWLRAIRQFAEYPVLIPFSRDDVLPPKQSAKHWFVCSLLQVLVWSIGFTKANFILQWFQCVTLQAGAQTALRLQRIVEECSNGAWQARGTCSKWVHCRLRVNNFLGGFDLALVCMQPLLRLPNQLLKASLVLNTLWIEWSASATGQLFKTLCQAKTLAGASIEDRLNTRHETDLSIDIRILKVSWFPG